MAPPAVKRTTFHEKGDPDAGAVMNCISLYTEYQTFHKKSVKLLMILSEVNGRRRAGCRRKAICDRT
jgi:hypothetical protein